MRSVFKKYGVFEAVREKLRQFSGPLFLVVSVLVFVGAVANLSYLAHLIPASYRGYDDWVLHFLLYFSFSAFWFMRFRIGVLTVPLLLSIAIFAELVQGVRTDLDFSIIDLLANVAGTLCGIMVVAIAPVDLNSNSGHDNHHAA